MNKLKLQVARWKFYYTRHIRVHLIYALLFTALAINAYSYMLWKQEWKYQSSLRGDAYIIREVVATPASASADEVMPVRNVKIGKKGSLADRNNNPGNLIFANQKGATVGEKGFAKFSTPQDGYNAVINQVKIDQMRGYTIKEFISKYAPPKENNTELYIKTITKNLLINEINNEALAKQLILFESGSVVN